MNHRSSAASEGQFPIDLMNRMYDSHDPMVQILYKYRACNQYGLDALKAHAVWFSTPSELNDPFDCRLRLPTSIRADDIESVRRNLVGVAPYNLGIRSPREVADFVGGSQELATLEPLGLIAAQFKHRRLLKHIQRIDAKKDDWVHDLIVMAREIAEFYLKDITVFCLSECNAHPLMWAHYAASHTGFCTGYVCPVGIGNPRTIFKVAYPETLPSISCWQLIQDPGAVHRDLVVTKTSHWSYEHEWRMTFGNIPGLLDKLLPYREIIFGARMSDADQARVREAVGRRQVIFRRAVLHEDTGAIAIHPA